MRMITHLLRRVGLVHPSELIKEATQSAELRAKLHRAEAELKHTKTTLERVMHEIATAKDRQASAEQGEREANRQTAEANRNAVKWQVERDNMAAEHEAMGRELKEQVLLNADLMGQMMPMTVDAQAHSALVDSQRVQVLTQLTTRSLDVRHGLLNALLSPFAFNVAKHLVRKLTARGDLTEGREIEAKTANVLVRPPTLTLTE